MNTFIRWVLSIVIAAASNFAYGQVVPETSDILDDIFEFQQFFKKRFPDIPRSNYAQGVNALPQYDHRRPNWEFLTHSPLYEGEMAQARKDWSTPFKNGSNFDNCFLTHPPANNFPYYLH